MTYTAIISADRACRFCGQYHKIIVDEPVTGNLLDLSAEIEMAIADQAVEDGWLEGVCPVCRVQYRTRLNELHNADMDRVEVDL